MEEADPRLTQCADSEAFDGLLRAAGIAWQTLAADPAGQFARLRFTGPFQGRRVIWNCTLSTLVSVHAPRNFIEVGAEEATGRAIHIGLDIAAIDTAAIRKTIIMVRQYKLLGPGRHEFGVDARA